MKRSNRLVLLIGLFLAVVAFIGVFYLLSNNGDGGGDRGTALKTMTVLATKAIPLGTEVTPDAIKQEELPNNERAADAYTSTTLVVGKIARVDIAAGAQITASMFSAGGSAIDINTPPTKRAISVQVDQVTGVGTLIKPGDYVDMLVGFTADKFPVVTVNPDDDTITPVTGINATSVKLLLQGMQVLGTLLPPPPDETGTQDTTTDGTSTVLNGQQEIVVLSVSAQQAEVVKFAQMDGSISLVLRSSKDFQDPNDPKIPVTPLPDETTGIILRVLIDEYGVLVPQVVEALLPAQASPAP